MCWILSLACPPLHGNLARGGGYGSGLVELPFSDMANVMHLNEIRFNADENHRKVMFLDVVMHPQYDAGGNLVFDGKIGMWPFITKIPAARSTRNCSAGIFVTTLVNVNAAVYQDFVVNRDLPGIKTRMPNVNKQMVLQQDNATPHISISDAVLRCP
ncbi:hypothetical protein DYB31_012694 [Aphanomyces astaci]|uniref:Tc1-like transposase DDE domain-containing protein n=1 Tax=Aphanomyces astaci TaxID=112090 RepID=A0A397F6B4_APHAT|nr:hypothetical protein DYB31_012694 [Aphanomyces astaci]